VSVSLVVQHKKYMCRTAICGLSGCTIFLYIISQTHDFEKELLNAEIRILIFFYKLCVMNFSF